MVGQTVSSGLFVVTKLEPKERLEDELESCGNFVRQLVLQPPDQPSKSNQEIHDILTSTANANSENHEKVCLGLFYLILTDPDSSSRAFQDLALITRDHFGSILTKLTVIIMEFYFRLVQIDFSFQNFMGDSTFERFRHYVSRKMLRCQV